MMSNTVYHIWGFVDPNLRPSGVEVTTYEGEIAAIANAVITGIEGQGHSVTWNTLRTFGGELLEVRAFVDVNGTEMWHLFTSRNATSWLPDKEEDNE